MTGILLLACGLFIASGFLALVAYSSRRLATAVAALGGVLGCALGVTASIGVLMGRPGPELSLLWPEPIATLIVGVDALSALFLVPLFVIGGLAAVYGRSYLLGGDETRSLAAPSFFFNLLLASMTLVLLARTTIVFLVAWEAMTLSSYLLVTFDHQLAAVRRAGWVYLIAGHVGVAALLALFLVLGRTSGGLAFAGFHAAAAAAPVGPVFVLAALGFGIKAGFVPLHVWLPEAHAAAPSHVSALMSGVMIKVGLYGFLRTLGFVTPAWWWGPALMALGLAGALLGIALAIYQRDLKRVLAYSSIENMGIILLGLGLGYWGTARGDVQVAALGFAGAFLHTWNHALMKGLLFLAAGSVLHGSGTRDIERLGGLMRSMRWTGAAMVVGATAIAGLPPFAGFAGEWLIYLGLIQRGMASDGGGLVALLAVGALALVGALAALCFVRLVGIVLLGSPRGPEAEGAHESSPWMTWPMAGLAVAVISVAFVPDRVVALQASAVADLAGAGVARQLLVAASSLAPIVRANLAVWAAVALLAVVLTALVGKRRAVDDTWGCGYLQPTARMQYTGSSFSQLLTRKLYPASLRATESLTAPRSLFPAPGRYVVESPDPMTRGVYEPFFTRWADRFASLRWLQQGLVHVYLLYILLVVLGALAWTSLSDWMGV